jgi:hypothetical protein
MNLFNLPDPPELPRDQLIAERLLARLNAEIGRRSEQHASDFHAFWDDSICTPDEILEAMGDAAPLMLATASENLTGFARLAALVGKTLNDVISPADYMPRRQFIVDEETGAVTLAPPADGFDAWGRPIVTPE